jgi:hypothetical protein
MLVYEKALRISSKSKSTMGTGRIINLATTDANRVLDLFFFSKGLLFVKTVLIQEILKINFI